MLTYPVFPFTTGVFLLHVGLWCYPGPSVLPSSRRCRHSALHNLRPSTLVGVQRPCRSWGPRDFLVYFDLFCIISNTHATRIFEETVRKTPRKICCDHVHISFGVGFYRPSRFLQATPTLKVTPHRQVGIRRAELDLKYRGSWERMGKDGKGASHGPCRMPYMASEDRDGVLSKKDGVLASLVEGSLRPVTHEF